MKARYRLWQIMLAIAVLAGLFAALGVIGAVGIVVVSCVVFLPILLAAPGRRLRAAVWITSIYPYLILSSFYATWLAAWCALGHRPRVSLDDPKYIGPVVDAVGAVPVILAEFGIPLIWFVCAPVMFAVSYWNMAQKKTPPWNGTLQLLVPLFAWLSAYAILRGDPGWVIEWYFD
jgi:hypothetical protein